MITSAFAPVLAPGTDVNKRSKRWHIPINFGPTRATWLREIAGGARPRQGWNTVTM